MLKLRALVVEDCAAMRNLLMQMLPLTGLAEFDYVEAENGAIALAKFHPEQIDVIFVDCNMPELSGTDFVRKVRAMGSTEHIPIVMVTGLRAMSSVEEALDEAGADLYITKPYTIDELRKKLTSVVAGIDAQRQVGSGGAAHGFPNRFIGSAP